MKSLALVIIARNESRCITRCLESARHLVDKMVVLDTGSDDNTADLARAAGAEVHHHTWTNHFAEARNKAFELADADWSLVLDADEWLDADCDAGSLRAFVEGKPAVGLVRVRSTFDQGDRVEAADAWIPRVLPRGVRYIGRIHEQPVSMHPEQRIGLLVQHDGYRKDIAVKKHARNWALLQIALKESPESAYFHYQAGVQAEVAAMWEQACEYYATARRLGGLGQNFAHDLGCRSVHALARMRRYEESLELGLRLRERWPQSSDIFFTFGDLCLDVAAADTARALDIWLPAAEGAWLKCLELGEDNNLPSHVVGRGSFLAAHNLAVIYEGIGQVDAARRYREVAEQGKEALLAIQGPDTTPASEPLPAATRQLRVGERTLVMAEAAESVA